ncbi:MAG TPA: flagellar hook-basal body complex protein FliE [Firmicutes bacterium]|jgi:flagellar hook-basal body complex protein FliE|nr:flagellar hook-basal body complex protein FliE [Bacillota bacterium]HOQ23581.1 flagellar hook-basal body complex protein FliE [Bacillota bacterium]HPT67246.1 flagellar hook-basal body complex protein FliE [Bacillota bacterium]
MAIVPTRFVLPPLSTSSLQPAAETIPAKTGGFAEILRNALNEVNQAQLEAQRTDLLLAQGKLANVHEAIIAAEKASLTLELTVQIRNRIIEAYQEIMRMNV